MGVVKSEQVFAGEAVGGVGLLRDTWEVESEFAKDAVEVAGGELVVDDKIRGSAAALEVELVPKRSGVHARKTPLDRERGEFGSG